MSARLFLSAGRRSGFAAMCAPHLLAPQRITCETDVMTAVRTSRDRPVSALALLAGPRFGPLFATQFLSAFNDNALRNALVLMIAYGGEGGALSAQILIPLAAGLFTVPFFLCSA